MQDLRHAGRAVDRVRVADHDRPVALLLEKAYRLVGTAIHERREIYLFNDLTKHSWRVPLPPAPQALSALYVLDVGQDENRNVAVQFGISAIPTVMVFKGGEEVKKFVGMQTKKDFKAALDEVLV